MGLAQTEVYEVATFYHHFDVVKEGEARAAGADGARLRRPVLRDGRRAATCWQRLPALLGPRRARASPRRASAAASRRRPSAVRPASGRRRPRRDAVQAAVQAGADDAPARRATSTSTPTGPQGGYALLQRLRRRRARGRGGASRRMEDSGLRGLGGAGFPGRAQVAHRARRAGAAADGGQHRRGRARHLQGPRTTSSATRTASSKAC